MTKNPLSGAIAPRTSAPIALSSALCRPTSSRTRTIVPSRAPCRGVDGAGQLIERLARLEFLKGRADGGGRDRSLRVERRAGRGHLGEILDAAQAAAGAPAHRAPARQMRLQPLAGKRDLELPAVLDALDLNAPNILDRFGDLFGQRKAAGEILEVPRRRHHDGEGRASDDNLNRGLDGDRSRKLRPARAGIVGKGPDWNVDRARALTRPHRPKLSRSGAPRPPARDRASASRRNGWSAAPAPPSPCIRGNWSPSRNSRW